MEPIVHYILKHGKWGYIARFNRIVVDVATVEEAYWFHDYAKALQVKGLAVDPHNIQILSVTIEEVV